jgi:mRNA interferase MazF
VKRGDLWIFSGGPDYAGKPRPMAILQADTFAGLIQSVTVCPLTTEKIEAPLFRLPVEPNTGNGLKELSHLMVDKITTLPRGKAGQRIGRLDPGDIVRLNQAMLVFLGLAATTRRRAKREA